MDTVQTPAKGGAKTQKKKIGTISTSKTKARATASTQGKKGGGTKAPKARGKAKKKAPTPLPTRSSSRRSVQPIRHEETDYLSLQYALRISLEASKPKVGRRRRAAPRRAASEPWPQRLPPTRQPPARYCTRRPHSLPFDAHARVPSQRVLPAKAESTDATDAAERPTADTDDDAMEVEEKGKGKTKGKGKGKAAAVEEDEAEGQEEQKEEVEEEEEEEEEEVEEVKVTKKRKKKVGAQTNVAVGHARPPHSHSIVYLSHLITHPTPPP